MVFKDLLRRSKNVFGGDEAFVFEEKRFTYRDFGERIDRCSDALIRLGMEKGDRMAVLAENCSRYLELYFGITNVGGVSVPLSYRLHPDELMTILEDAGAKGLVFSREFVDQVEKMRTSLKRVSYYVLLDGEKDGFHNYESLLADAKAEEPGVSLEENDDFCPLYTNGTLSQPKGVLLFHKNIVANTFNQCVELNIQPGSVNLPISPFYHAANAHAFCHIYVRGEIIILKHFHTEKAPEIIEREKVTNAFIVPTILYRILDLANIIRFNLSSLKTIFYGGASITDQRLEEAFAKGLALAGCGKTPEFSQFSFSIF